MDYTQASLRFRIAKALRYVRLYGPSRTLAKVRGQLHMKKKYDTLPSRRERDSSRHVGLIGCGNFAFSNTAYYLQKHKGATIRACMDTDINKAASLFETYDLDYYTADACEIINDPQIDLIYIASNHASHAEYAIDCLKAGKNVHIEKPHVVTHDQLERLCAAMETSPGKVSLGFNRPFSAIGTAIREALAEQPGAAMLNWFVAGHAIEPDHWYFKAEEGGRVLGNLCHWTDFSYHCVDPQGRYPIVITPTRAAKSDCDIAVTYTFGDGSIGIITFSAKGHTFEGVREKFAAHRGDTLIAMEDFHHLTIETGARKRRLGGLFRDHGHELAITSIYDAVRSPESATPMISASYVWETGELFLKTKQALDESRQIIVQAYKAHSQRSFSGTTAVLIKAESGKV